MFCPKCGASLEDGARFCPACGSMIDAPEVETPAEPVYEEPVFEAPAAEPVTEAPAAEEGYTPAAEPAKKSSFLDKLPVSPKILGICAGALVAVILLIVLLTSGGGASGAYTFTEPQLFATANDGTVYVVSQSGKVRDAGDPPLTSMDVIRMNWLNDELGELKSSGLYNNIRTIETAQGAWISIDGRKVLNFCLSPVV